MLTTIAVVIVFGTICIIVSATIDVIGFIHLHCFTYLGQDQVVSVIILTDYVFILCD